MQIFSWIGNVFGYLLWFFYEFTKNYGVSIILFTIVLKIIMFPFSIKQQKSMAKNTRLQGKQKEIQKKYGDNKQKMSEEMQKLYQQEGVNPMGGCLTSIIPLIIMMGIYYSVVNPLQNTLHIAGSKVTEAMQLLQQVPGVGNLFSGFYGEIDLVKHFDFFKDFLPMFSADEAANIASFGQGFNFLGLNLLDTPQSSSFSSMLWLIPVLCLVSSLVTQWLMPKITGNQMAMQGCMKWKMFILPLFSAWIAYTVPAAVGFYWIINTVLQFLQTWVLNIFYNADTMIAKEEAARIALREIEEKKLKMIALPEGPRNMGGLPASQKKAEPQKSAKKSSGRKKGSNKSTSDYLGSKKG